MPIPLPPVEVLRQLLQYDPCTGFLSWKHRPQKFCKTSQEYKRWNKANSGKKINTKDTTGYSIVTIFNRQYKQHRVCWAMHYGTEPSEFIDHINGDKGDNRLENLRIVSARGNARNRKRISRNKSGYNGVSLCRSGKWLAYINAKSDRLFLGKFNCATAAAIARKKFEKTEGYHENHGRF
jgi:hypothetical protein